VEPVLAETTGGEADHFIAENAESALSPRR
jgi:hypothetical protein